MSENTAVLHFITPPGAEVSRHPSGGFLVEPFDAPPYLIGVDGVQRTFLRKIERITPANG